MYKMIILILIEKFIYAKRNTIYIYKIIHNLNLFFLIQIKIEKNSLKRRL